MNVPKILVPCVLAGMALAASLLPQKSTGANADDSSLSQALLTVQAQQQLMAANQAKIDLKLAAITEDLRIARLYVARAGGAKKK